MMEDSNDSSGKDDSENFNNYLGVADEYQDGTIDCLDIFDKALILKHELWESFLDSARD